MQELSPNHKAQVGTLRTWEFHYLKKAPWIRRRKIDKRDENGVQELEPYFVYRRRSARVIASIFNRNGASMIHVRVVRATFKEAWGEGQSEQQGLLWTVQKTARSQLSWDTIKDRPACKRKKGEICQDRKVRCFGWEDILVLALDRDWRHKRDSCIGVHEWNR